MTEAATFQRASDPRMLAALALMLAVAGALAISPPASAALDGTTAMLCSLAALMECDASKCERGTTDEADLPNFVRIDIPNKLVTAVPGARTTGIKSFARLDGRLILQGGENGRGWTATIAEDSGKMAIAVADQDYTFAIFGACITP